MHANFENMPYFTLLTSNAGKAPNKILLGNELKLYYWDLNCLKDRSIEPYFCIPPLEFDLYSMWLYEHQHFTEKGFYCVEDEWADDYILDKELVPLENLLDKFVFLKIRTEENQGNQFFIEELFDPTAVFSYWRQRNQFTEISRWRNLGLGAGIYNNLPHNSNYFDRNFLCTCGHAGCDYMEVWYIRYVDSYSIPFVLDRSGKIIFDLQYIADLYTWEEIDYVEADYATRDSYRNFPFSFEAEKFRVFEKTLFPNIKPAP